MKTTRTLVVDLNKALVDQYVASLERLPIQKKTREILIDGFRDGVRTGTENALKMVGVIVED